MQDSIYRRYFAEWIANPNPKAEPYQMKFRDLNMETSLRVFCGSYIAEDSVQEISDKYWLITQALELVNFPFAFPGTKVWNACKAREIAVKHLKQAAADSKKAMRAGKEPDCLLDEWVQEIIAKKVREYTDKEMALVLLSFIFASQGASPLLPPFLPSYSPLLLPQTPCPPPSPSPSNSSPTTPKSSPKSAPNNTPSVATTPSPRCRSRGSNRCPTPTR
jgi:hypothetical protein